MEHRWGERVALRLTVELSSGSLPPIAGSLENVSSSGAFVRTGEPRPARGPVEVTLRESDCDHNNGMRLPAYVVRETETGVGIEWCEFAPHVVCELMTRDRRTGCTRARARAQPPARRSPREPNTTSINTLPVVASAAKEWTCGPPS
jgi:hypothetical protein